MRRLLGLFVAGLLAVGGAAAAGEPVDLQLVLAVDISRSVDDEEFHLQREGYADALKDPRVLASILSGKHRAIGVSTP